jgi:hypothetical protein
MNHFLVNLKPADADDVAKLILETAKEARAKSPDAEVLIRLASNPTTGRFAAYASIITPETQVVIYHAEDL